MTEETVFGFIGTGKMGFPIAANLLHAGHNVRVYNRSRDKAEPLADQGATVVDTPAQAAEAATLVFSVLSDDAALEQITLGDDGLLGRLGQGGIHVSSSTVSPETSRALAARHSSCGEHYLTATVFGRPEIAQAAKLTICVSGDSEAKRRAWPALEALGQRIEDFGDDPGAANVVKLAGNFMIAAAMEAMAEAFTLAEKNGIDREQVANLYGQTLFACPVYQGYGKAIAAQKYEPAGFALPLGLKDMTLALELAKRSTMPMPLADLVRQRYTASVAKGRSALDWSGLALEVSEAAGLSRGDG